MGCHNGSWNEKDWKPLETNPKQQVGDSRALFDRQLENGSPLMCPTAKPDQTFMAFSSNKVSGLVLIEFWLPWQPLLRPRSVFASSARSANDDAPKPKRSEKKCGKSFRSRTSTTTPVRSVKKWPPPSFPRHAFLLAVCLVAFWLQLCVRAWSSRSQQTAEGIKAKFLKNCKDGHGDCRARHWIRCGFAHSVLRACQKLIWEWVEHHSVYSFAASPLYDCWEPGVQALPNLQIVFTGVA